MGKLSQIFDKKQWQNNKTLYTCLCLLEKLAKKKNLKYLIYLVLGYYLAYAVAKGNGWLPKKKLNGKHVFITGAGCGIGRLMAFILAEKGCKVSLADLNFKSVQQVAIELK